MDIYSNASYMDWRANYSSVSGGLSLQLSEEGGVTTSKDRSKTSAKLLAISVGMGDIRPLILLEDRIMVAASLPSNSGHFNSIPMSPFSLTFRSRSSTYK